MLNGIIQNNAIEDEVFSPDSMTIPNINGMKLSDNNPANFNGQIIYVDFDGANNVTYNNAALNINIDNIDVANSGLDQTRINKVISELNTTYAGSGVYFTISPDASRDLSNSSLTLSSSSLASTIYVGNAGSSFSQYGKFLGLSETIDSGNKIKNEEAFVFTDKINSDVTITETIAHEAGHLLGFEHENSPTGTLNAYGLNYTGQISGYKVSGIYGWSYQFDVELSEQSQIVISLDLQFVGDDPGYELRKQWLDGIERIWSNQYFLVDAESRLPIVVDVNEVTGNADQVVTVHSGLGRANMTNWYTISYWPQDYQDKIAAHEFGHMMGLYDEYINGGVSPEKLIDDNSIMGQNHGAVRERFFTQIEQWSESKTGRSMSLLKIYEQEVTIAVLDGVAGEPGDSGIFRITRTGDSTNALTVYFTTIGTATSGNDYTLKNGITELAGSVVIAAGQSYVDVTLVVIDDLPFEDTETATMDLTANAAYTLAPTSKATIYITDDDNEYLFTPVVSSHTVTGESVSLGTQIILNGGIANRGTISNCGWQNVSSGGMTTSTTISSDGWQSISSGGIAKNTIINSGASQCVIGVATSTTINSGGWQDIFSSGMVTSTIINSGGTQIVDFYGLASSTTINSGGEQYVNYDGVANAATVNLLGIQHLSGGVANSTTLAGGSQNIYEYGIASGTIVNTNGRVYVSSGGIANAATVNAYGAQHIYTGGVANSTLVNSGAQYVSGGTANATTVSKGGQVIYTGGIASSTFINSGTWQGISSGGVANTTTLNAGWQYLYTGGVASSTTVNSAGCQVVFSGATASSATVNSGGQIISSGGTATTTIINAGGSQIIKGLTNGATVNAGIQFVSSGGTASGTLVNLNGKMQIYSGGRANSTTLSGGIQNIYAGGTASATNVNLSGRQIVYYGGTANSARVNSGGSMFVSSGGSTNSGTVNSGGSMFVSSGGVANSTTLAGGSQNIYVGGTASGTIVNTNGRMYVSAGGLANNTTVNSLGIQNLSSGTVNGTTINTGGYQYIYYNSIANGTTINTGGYQIVLLKGTANSTIINANGNQFVYTGGMASGTTVNAKGKMYVSSGGIANGATINAYGLQHIYRGGVANSTLVNSGGQYVSSGGTANATTVSKGGQVIYSSGIASGAVINSGTWQGVSSGGVANTTTLNAGWQYLYTGGLASATTVNSAGCQIIFSGATASSAVVNSGGQIISSGGTAATTTINAGGSQIIKGLANGATVNAGVQFVSSGGSASGTVVNLNGKMQVYSGGKANSTTLSGGIQNIYSGGQASGTNVNLSGKQIVYSGGTANSATINSGGSLFVSSGGILSGSLTIDGGHVTVAYSNNMQTPVVSFKLAAAQVNDAILVIQTGVTGDVSGSTFNLNIDNTATGSYILADGANLTSMSSVTFSVTDNGQNVSMQVGTSYTFADGDHLSLSFSDSTRDKLIAAFTNNPPAAPRPIVFNLNAEVPAASTFDNAKIVDSVQQTGWVTLAGNDDDYRFDLASPVTGGTLRLHNLTGGNADLSLYNASGTLLQSSNNTGTIEDSIISNLAAGTYFARVNAVSGNIDYKLDFDKKYVTGMLAG